MIDGEKVDRETFFDTLNEWGKKRQEVCCTAPQHTLRGHQCQWT